MRREFVYYTRDSPHNVQHRLRYMLTLYSSGAPIRDLPQHFPSLLDAWALSNRLSDEVCKEHGWPTCRDWDFSLSNLNHYNWCFWLVGLALALEITEAQWQRLIHLVGGEGEDVLLDRVIATRSPARRVGTRLLHAKPYARLLKAVDAPADQQAALLRDFVDHWYPEVKRPAPRNKKAPTVEPFWYIYGDPAKHPLEMGSYFGRWCIEAVAAVKAFGLDDSRAWGTSTIPATCCALMAPAPTRSGKCRKQAGLPGCSASGAVKRVRQTRLPAKVGRIPRPCGGLGFTIGKAAQGNANSVTTTQAVGSTLGSVQGDVSIQAGKDLQLKDSDVIAGQDITMAAQNVRIEHAEHTQAQQTSSYSKQSGLTVALSGGVVDAAQTAVSAAQAAGNSNNSRLAALQSVKAGLAGYQALQTAQQGGSSGEVADPSFAGVSVSLGSQRSQSQSQTSSSNASSSELNAGRNVYIIATGDGSKGADGVAQNGDISVIGSSIKAQNVTLDAARDITLQSAHNRSDTTGSNSSSGAAIGVSVSVGVGSGKAGISVFANANRASGKENGDTDSYTETNLTAGQTLTLNSGRDTTLTGALASGDSIAANVGRNLTLSSQQDQGHYASQQRRGG